MALSLEDAQVQDFFAFLRLKNVAAGTLDQYRWALSDFVRYLPSDLHLQLTDQALKEITPRVETALDKDSCNY